MQEPVPGFPSFFFDESGPGHADFFKVWTKTQPLPAKCLRGAVSPGVPGIFPNFPLYATYCFQVYYTIRIVIVMR